MPRTSAASASACWNVGQLLVFEFQQADGLSPICTLASAVDVADDAPGLSLSFARVFPEPISTLSTGPVGRGWSMIGRCP